MTYRRFLACVSGLLLATEVALGAPIVTSIARLMPGPVTTADTVTWRVTFSESVTGVDAGDFALTPVDGAATGTVSSVNGTGAVYTVTASSLSGTGTLRLDLNASSTGITSLSSSSLSSGFTMGQPYTHTRGSVVVGWGENTYGQLGNNSTAYQSTVPVAVDTSGVLGSKTVVAVSGAQVHSLALCSDGTVAAWGRNDQGQLGNNSTTNSPVPVAVNTAGVLAGKTVVAVAAGDYYSLALCSDGTVATWGFNSVGQLGNNSTTNSSVPVAVNTAGVLAGKTVVAVAAGGFHSLALCSDGTVVTWGSNSAGMLGNNSTTNSAVPVAVNTAGVLAGKTVVAVAAGCNHSLALCSDGTVAAWGWNAFGQLGNNSTTNRAVPVAVNTSGVLAGKSVVALAAGFAHSLVLCSDGTIAIWGGNTAGQLGSNSTTQTNVPVALSTNGCLVGKSVVAVSAGYSFTLALCNDGTVATWGSNSYGQLGNNSVTHSTIPVAVNTDSLTGSALAGRTVYLVGSSSVAWQSLALASLLYFGDFIYSETATGITIESYVGTAATLAMPDTIAGKPVTVIAAKAFEKNATLTNVILPTFLVTIGDSAFAECSALTSASLPPTLTSIGHGAFAFCPKLTGIVFPNGLTSIGQGGFFECTGLTNITLPDSLTTLDLGSFAQCTGLTSVTLPGHLTSIGAATFLGCTALTTVILPIGLTSISNNAFKGCTGMTSAAFLGHAPTTFGTNVFSGTAAGFTILYLPGANGFTAPTWQGYTSQQLVPAPLQLGRQSTDIVLTIPTTFGLPYQLERTFNLSTGPWQPLGAAFTGTGSALTYRDTGATASTRAAFYRLRLVSPQ